MYYLHDDVGALKDLDHNSKAELNKKWSSDKSATETEWLKRSIPSSTSTLCVLSMPPHLNVVTVCCSLGSGSGSGSGYWKLKVSHLTFVGPSFALCIFVFAHFGRLLMPLALVQSNFKQKQRNPGSKRIKGKGIAQYWVAKWVVMMQLSFFPWSLCCFFHFKVASATT